MQRNDIHGVEQAPKALSTYLLQRGGKNPFGEANFRLVWSPNRMRVRGGKFEDWDKTLSVQERGGIIRTESGLVLPSSARPLRTFVGLREKPKYNFDAGWIVERWVPASYYGAKDDWNSRVLPGTSIPFGGPYPEHGDYELCHYSAALELPSITELQNVIGRSEKSRDEHQVNTQQALLERLHDDVAEYQKQITAERAESEAWIRDFMTPFFSSSAPMGALRSRLLEQQGITSHNGN